MKGQRALERMVQREVGEQKGRRKTREDREG